MGDGEGSKDDRVTERPADGPARGEPGSGEDLGSTSQGEPGADAASERTGPDAGRPSLDPDHPDDTNEGGDLRATVVEPGGEEDSPRAR